jgi:tetratricopeptide (TPR) repeat protein
MFNNGLEYDKDYFLLYYGLGSVYSDLERYDDSIKAIDTYLLKETDNNLKSAAYNIKGLDYAKEDLMDDAKKMFNKSLELNPNNEYAKTNLNHASNLSNSVSSTSTPEPTTTPEESTTTSSDPSYKSYINDRFAFSIDYPITFIASPSPTNNDGITLSSQDGNTELTVSGINNVLNQTPTSAYNDLLKDHSNAAYKDQESNWFVVSWLEGDKIVYEKSVVGSGSMNTFIIKYPSKQKDYYNSIVSQLNSSFKTPGIELAH